MIRLCPKGHRVATRRCPQCERERSRRRAPITKALYGTDHRRARRALMDQLPGYCGYGCGTWLTPDGKWNAAHVVDGDPSAGYIASCIPCNQKARRP